MFTSKIKSFFTSAYVKYGVVLIFVIGGGFVFFGGDDNGIKTIIVEPGELVREVSVSGKVVAAKDVDLVFSQNGRVNAVYADVGDTVSAGDIIASIENGDAYADILQKEAAYESALAKLDALKSGTRSEQIAITESNVASAEASLDQSTQTLIDEMREAHTTADDAIHTKVDQFFSNARTSEASINILTGSQSRSEIEAQRVQIEGTLNSWAAMSISLSVDDELLGAAQIASQYMQTVSSFLQTIALVVADAQPTGTLTQTTIDKYRTDVATARTNVRNAQSALTTAVTSYKSDVAALATAQRTLELELAGSTIEDIAAQEAQVKAALADLEKARALYRKTLVTAPFAGVVTRMDAKVGGSASSDSKLISLIGIDALQVESFVPEINTPLLSVDNPAVVTLDAYGSAVPFSARVVSIDPAETIRDGVSTYRAILQFDNQDPRIRPGMTANIAVTTEEKQNVLTVPQGSVFKRNNDTNIVYVKEGETIVERIVETGSISSSGNIEITSGLSAGDVVLLDEPSD